MQAPAILGGPKTWHLLCLSVPPQKHQSEQAKSHASRVCANDCDFGTRMGFEHAVLAPVAPAAAAAAVHGMHRCAGVDAVRPVSHALDATCMHAQHLHAISGDIW